MATGTAEIDLIEYVRNGNRSGFTLIEVLLVLALVGLLTGIVAGNAGAFISGGDFEPPERVLKKSVLDALYFASERKRATFLSYFEKNATFCVSDTSGTLLSKHVVFKKLDNLEDSELPIVEFYAVGPLAGPMGNETKYDEKGLQLSRIRFHAGCSVPFLAKIRFQQNEETLYFDPFSGYAIKQIGE